MTGRGRRTAARVARAALRPLAVVALTLPALLALTVPALASTPSPSPGPTASTTAASDGAGAAGAPDGQRAAVAAWASKDGLALLRQAVGADARITLSGPVAVRAWNEDPSANADDPTVSTDDWAVAATVDGTATAVLLATDAASAPTGQLVQDTDVADAVADLDGAQGTDLVRDADGAWYLLADSTVTAVGTAARAELAGPVEVGAYLDVLRERRSGETGGTTATATSSGRDWSVWATVAGVVLVGAVIIVITVRHERRVMAPLREGAAAGAETHGAPAHRAGATAVPTVTPGPGGQGAGAADGSHETGREVVADVAGRPGASSTTSPEDGAGAPRA